MATALPLERHGVLGRFVAPETEADYRLWHARRIRGLFIAMGLTSLGIWIVVPPIAQAYFDIEDLAPIYVVSWGVNIPVISAAIVYMRRRDSRQIANLAAFLIVLVFVDTVALASFLKDSTAYGYALAATYFGLLAPVNQLPVRTTVAVGSIVTAVGVTTTLNAAGTTEVHVVATVFIVFSTLVTGVALAVVNERGLRDRYVDERVIEHQRGLIRRYAPSSVVSRIELGDTTVDQPQRRKVTVFFSDVVGFTTMADRVDPEALAHIVNDYLGSLADLIERHGGTLNEFAGDGVMAIFGAPDELEPIDQVLAALAAARELQASLPEWSRGWYQHGIVEDAKARIGINTGTVSVGTFGSTVRATYTGIGLQTNIAARVQAEAEPGGILLSNTSWHLVKDTVRCESRGTVTVKGVHFPIELYEPVA